MTTYLFSRAGSDDLRDMPRELMVGQMFFDLWRTQQHPYKALSDGDVMLMFHTRSRRLTWELRAAAVTKKPYDSIPEALDVLRGHFGLVDSELDQYIWQRPASGWLMAWAAEIVRPLDVSVPSGFKMTDYGGRNGYVDLDRVPESMRPALPAPTREPVLTLPAAYIGGVQADQTGSRYIPVAVRGRVWARDGGRCVECGRSVSEIELHFDHRYPYSRGGGNDADNLQLLCRDHNLRKGARVLPGLESPAGLSAREAWAARLGRPRDTALVDLVRALGTDSAESAELLEEEAAFGDVEEVTVVLAALPELQASERLRAETAWGRYRTGDDGQAGDIARSLLGSPDRDVEAIASYLVAMLDGPTLDLLRAAVTSTDAPIRHSAHLELAHLYADDGDMASAKHHLQSALSADDAEVRGMAAMLLWEIRMHESDAGGAGVTELEGLLRIGLGGDVDTRARAALELINIIDASDDVTRSLLDIAKQSAVIRAEPALAVFDAALDPNPDGALQRLEELAASNDDFTSSLASRLLCVDGTAVTPR